LHAKPQNANKGHWVEADMSVLSYWSKQLINKFCSCFSLIDPVTKRVVNTQSIKRVYKDNIIPGNYTGFSVDRMAKFDVNLIRYF
jgi:hypothetical protein